MNNIDEAAKDYADINSTTDIDDEERYFNYKTREYDAFKAGAEWMYKEKIDKTWISLETRFPPKNKTVIVKNVINNNIGFFNTSHRFQNTYLFLIKNYTHWREIDDIL